jgi:hypothetical protein
MPNVWIILGAVVGAINLRLLIPGLAAFLGHGEWSVRSHVHDQHPRLTL